MLPMGRYGISSATSVAKDMIRSFPGLKLALMVGIGGGAPTYERDIRLGDVVVSIPDGKSGRVIQYDSGKRLPNNQFQQTGQLDSPPSVLLQALPEIQRRHNDPREPDRIAQHMELMSDRPDYERPAVDRLYRSDYEHKSRRKDCKDCGDDGLEEREPRYGTRKVMIHYGIVASGNSVMKDAKQRDKYADEHNVLCFEMEAGGLTNNFPCLVIRGISDYSDSHKNHKWHKFAALAAAAFARELLYVLKPQKVAVVPSWVGKLDKMLSGIGEGVDRIYEHTEYIRDRQQSSEEQAVLDWITPVEYAYEQSAAFSRRFEGTGTWLLYTNEFNTWADEEGKTLFCPGIPGAGKTIITSLVVNHIQSKYQANVGIAYVYCNFKRREEQNTEHLLRSLLKQLAQGRTQLPKMVKSMHESKMHLSTETALQALTSVAIEFARVYIVIDALDECCVSSRERQTFLNAIFKFQSETGANIFATSRYDDDIGIAFRGSLLVDIKASNSDVERYLDGQISKASSDIWDDDLQSKVKSGILTSVDGMFLLVHLHAENLIAKPTKGHIKEALQGLKKGVEGLHLLYKQAMERIASQEETTRKLAYNILAWIVHAKRPLSIVELQHALAVKENTTRLDKDYMPSVATINSVCAGLVTTDSQTGMVRLVHFTAQEFFETTAAHWRPDVHAQLTRDCVTYMLFDPAEEVLYDYAAQNWGHHARASLDCEQNFVLSFLRNSLKFRPAVEVLVSHLSDLTIADYKSMPMTVLHVAAYFGLNIEIVKEVWKHCDPNTKDFTGRTPLSWAANNGHYEVVKLLLSRDDVEADATDPWDWTALSFAANKGHEEVVKLLLKRDNTESSLLVIDRLPMILAAKGGHFKIVELLRSQIERKLRNGCVFVRLG